MYCQNIPSYIDINNACEVIRRFLFLELQPNSFFNSIYKLKNQLTDMMLSQKSKHNKISDYFISK